ncbi:MAG: hypothetical protein OXI43_19055 [Candidatus Poribacteria bacterium]|nr:hypothetical protein [Candidatus Poribacteria bacterium]
MKISEQVGAKIYKTTPYFWRCYQNLPRVVQQQADNKFELLQQDSKHPSLNLKRVGKRWAVRINRDYRALAREENGTLVWFWIGKHDEYIRRIRHQDD